MTVLILIPCYRFITPKGTMGTTSIAELMTNSWNMAREYLFGAGGENDEQTVYFSKYVLGLMLALLASFALGAVSVIYTTVNGFAYFRGDCKESKRKALFITLVPNRVLLCIYHALLLPIFLFPMMMPSIYRGILTTYVEIVYSPFNLIFIALGLYLAMAVIIFLSAGYESDLGMNLFVRRKPFDGRAETTHTYDEDREARDEYESMSQRAKDEQLERIKRLLNQNETEEEDDK